jgi:uncharacterized protein YbjT (DUF2867 family)
MLILCGGIMTHLVLGGTGTVGGAVVKRLLADGQTVKVLTRTPERAALLPKGVQPVIGDLTNPATYPNIFKDFDTLFLLIANSITEVHEGLAAAGEAARAGVKRIVYLSVHRAEAGPAIPHFGGKIAIEEAIKRSGVPYTIIRPNNFYQNDYWFKDVILKYGIYPQPFGDTGLSRVDVDDIADASFNALTKSGHENQTYALVGPEALTATQTARMYSEALGREIKYGGNDLDAWTKANLAYLPHWMVWDFALMYKLFQDEGLIASDSDLKETVRVLGRQPKRFSDFVKITASAWKQPTHA